MYANVFCIIFVFYCTKSSQEFCFYSNEVKMNQMQTFLYLNELVIEIKLPSTASITKNKIQKHLPIARTKKNHNDTFTCSLN